MSHPVVYVDTSAVREGKPEELEEAMDRLAAFVQENVPRLLACGFFLDESRTRMTVVAVHPDSTSLAFHLDTGAAEFRKFSGLVELERIEVYGAVDAAVLERLHRKAESLGGGTVAVHGLHAGFSRLARQGVGSAMVSRRANSRCRCGRGGPVGVLYSAFREHGGIAHEAEIRAGAKRRDQGAGPRV